MPSAVVGAEVRRKRARDLARVDKAVTDTPHFLSDPREKAWVATTRKLHHWVPEQAPATGERHRRMTVRACRVTGWSPPRPRHHSPRSPLGT